MLCKCKCLRLYNFKWIQVQFTITIVHQWYFTLEKWRIYLYNFYIVQFCTPKPWDVLYWVKHTGMLNLFCCTPVSMLTKTCFTLCTNVGNLWMRYFFYSRSFLIPNRRWSILAIRILDLSSLEWHQHATFMWKMAFKQAHVGCWWNTAIQVNIWT